MTKQLNEAYANERTQIETLLKELNAKLKSHDNDRDQDKNFNWGHHGDAAHIRNTLQNLLGHND